MRSFNRLTLRQGSLMTRVSAELPGASNYTEKLNVRRDGVDEVTREGDMLYAPNQETGVGVGNQPTPGGPGANEPITGLWLLRAPNGKTANLAATQTTLYRYFGLESGAVFTADVYESGVYATSTGDWIIIGENFSTEGHRWEMESVNGYAIFNNGVDIPVSYRENEFEVTPLYELREAGIAAVGTICSHNGVLLCGDVSEIKSTEMDALMNGAYAYTNISDQPALFNRVQYRIIWSGLDEPLRWAPSVNGSIAAGSDQLTIDWPMASIKNGDEILITGAGENGGNFVTTIQFIAPGGLSINLVDIAITSVTDAVVQKSDSTGIFSGGALLQDDGSGILRILSLQDRVVVMKATSIFVGQYTGVFDAPFQFVRAYAGPLTLFWQWCAIAVTDDHILFAGRSHFYTFDLISRSPKLHPKLTLCDDAFFGPIGSFEMQDVWMADNKLISEIWIRLSAINESFTFLIYNYEVDECDLCDRIASAAASVERPIAGVTIGVAEQWFILGTIQGYIYQYGWTAKGIRVYTRGGSPPAGTAGGLPYTSTLAGGCAAFTDEIDEVHVTGYQVHVSTNSGSPAPPVTVTLQASHNPAILPSATIGIRILTAPAELPHISLHAKTTYVRDKLSWSGELKLVGRSWLTKKIESRNITKVSV